MVRLLEAVCVLAGCWLLAAPSSLGYPAAHPHLRAGVVDLLAGSIVVMAAGFHLLQPVYGRWAGRVALLTGAGLLLAPVILSYQQDPAIDAALPNDLITGAVVVLTSGLAVRQAGRAARSGTRRRTWVRRFLGRLA